MSAGSAGQPGGVDRSRYVDLVFQGGGMRGIGLVGGFAVLEEQGYLPQRIAGNSAGAVVGALVAAGYNAPELYAILSEFDFRRFEDGDWSHRLPLLPTLSLLTDLGMYKGAVFLDWLQDLLAAKGVRTFRDLRYVDPDHPQAGPLYTLQVIASNISQSCALVLPEDATRLGIDPDDLSVALAVRMSMSIPLFFEPVRLRHPETGDEHLIVDGGLFSNFPVWLFDSKRIPRWPTFGLRFVEPNPRAAVLAREAVDREHLDGLHRDVDFLRSLVHFALDAHDRFSLERADYARTIAISTLGVRTTEFDLARDRVLALYEEGRAAATRFLATWSFEDYIREFRTPEVTTATA